MVRHSPCVGICKLDDTTGYCLGCGRTGDEVAQWLAMSEAERDSVWAKLPERLRKLAVRVRLLPWMASEIGAWAVETIAGRSGAWTVGASASAAEFACTRDRDIAIEQARGVVVARTSDAALRLRLPDKLRAFAVADGPIVLGLPNGRAAIPRLPAFKMLGPDSDAIDHGHQNDVLFDCGVGCKSSRVCIRTEDAKLVEKLSAFEGRQWPEVVSKIGAELQSSRPAYIIESAVARIETPTRVAQMALSSGATYPLPKDVVERSASLMLPQYASTVAIFSPAAA